MILDLNELEIKSTYLSDFGKKLDELTLAGTTFAKVKQQAKEIKNDIAAWQQAIKLNNKRER